MSKKLTKGQQETWDRLNYVPPPPKEPWVYSAGASAPINPTAGAVYFDTNMSVMRLYDGQQWKIIK